MNFTNWSSRQESAYLAIDWSMGERPSWWVSASLMWDFRLSTGKRFATSDLEAAVVHLSARLRRPQPDLRKLLFTFVPLSAGQEGLIDGGAVNVRAHHRLPYLRAQVKQLARLEALLSDFRPAVAGDVLAVFATAYSEGAGAVERLLDHEDPSSFLGLDLRTLDRWASEFNAYEVQELVRTERQRARVKREAEAVEKRNAPAVDPTHETLVKRYATQIMQFTGYFDASDFEPESQHEVRALELHRAVRAASSAEAEERAMVERDRYLIEHVLRKG